MSKVGYYIVYYSLYWWMFLHALLPFKVLYVFSDFLYLIVYKLIGYRLKVVRQNLKNSFPDKTDSERKDIERRFYHHFCDYFVETVKLLHISDREAEKRITFKNTELVKDLMKDGNSCLMFLGHYGNWEWVPSITRHFTDGEKLGQIYKQLKSKAVDDLFLKIRSRFGSFGIEKAQTARAIVNFRRAKDRILIGFMADQIPSVRNIHYWTNFLSQDSAVFTGVERLAKQSGFSVTYLDVKKVSRGHYACEVKLISANPAIEEEFSITERYVREMEKTILRDPAYWLWTHRRWKYTREEVAEIIGQGH